MFNLNQIAYGIISIIGNNHNFAYCLQKRNPFWSKKTFCRNKKIKKAKKPTEKPTEKAIKEYIIKIVDYNCSFVKLSDGACIKKDDIWNLCRYDDKVRKIIYPSGKVEYTPVFEKDRKEY